MRILLILSLLTIITTSCSSKLEIVNMHTLIYSKDLKKDNFYVKDQSRSFENLKGLWRWINNSDTLFLEVTPKYKQPYKKGTKNYENAFYDTAIVKVKFSKNGEILYDELNENIEKSCLVPKTVAVQTNVFHLKTPCIRGFSSSLLILKGDNSQLFFISPYTEKEEVLIVTENGYEIKVPNSIILDRVIE